MKKISGRRVLSVKSDKASIKVAVDGSHPETICIEFVANAFFKANDKINLNNILSFLNNSFSHSANQLFTTHSKALTADVFPQELRKNIILITKDFDESNDYYLAKYKNGDKLIFKFELYIHTKNCFKKDSVEIKFFEDREMENEASASIRSFCEGVVNSDLLNNKLFFTKKFKNGE